MIKNDEPTLLYSSFGSQEGVYGDGKYSVEDFLGGNQGFERINQYEFYRIYIGWSKELNDYLRFKFVIYLCRMDWLINTLIFKQKKDH